MTREKRKKISSDDDSENDECQCIHLHIRKKDGFKEIIASCNCPGKKKVKKEKIIDVGFKKSQRFVSEDLSTKVKKVKDDNRVPQIRLQRRPSKVANKRLPKRPANSFSLFYKDCNTSSQAQGRKKTLKEAADMWRKMDVESKTKYYKLQCEQKILYEKLKEDIHKLEELPDKGENDLFDGAVNRQGGLTKLVVSNLDYEVSDSDIKGIFSEFGPLRKAVVHYDRFGQSLGTADVTFERKSDAVKAMNQYNGIHLDGRPMNIQIACSTLPSPGRGRNNSLRRGGSRPFNKNRLSFHSRGQGGRGGASQRKVPTAKESDAELDAYVDLVLAVFPHMPYSVVQEDLQVTHSAEQTLDNILEGRLVAPVLDVHADEQNFDFDGFVDPYAESEEVDKQEDEQDFDYAKLVDPYDKISSEEQD